MNPRKVAIHIEESAYFTIIAWLIFYVVINNYYPNLKTECDPKADITKTYIDFCFFINQGTISIFTIGSISILMLSWINHQFNDAYNTRFWYRQIYKGVIIILILVALQYGGILNFGLVLLMIIFIFIATLLDIILKLEQRNSYY
jgi:hypothetical protein